MVRPQFEAPIEAAAFSGADTVLVLAGRVQRLRVGAQVSDEALPEGSSVGALTTAPNEEVWAAFINGKESQGRPLSSASAPNWTVAAQIRAMAWAPDDDTLYASDPARGGSTVSKLDCTPLAFSRASRGFPASPAALPSMRRGGSGSPL